MARVGCHLLGEETITDRTLDIFRETDFEDYMKESLANNLGPRGLAVVLCV
jgi:hypothetical protein